MKYLLILLLSALTLNGDAETIFSMDTTIDQTDNAIGSKEPMFYACKFGFQLRPVVCTDGMDGNRCKGWGRDPYNNEMISKLVDTIFPVASQLKEARLKGLPLLSKIAQDAYRGRVWNQPDYPDGRDDQWNSNYDYTRECPMHGYARHT